MDQRSGARSVARNANHSYQPTCRLPLSLPFCQTAPLPWPPRSRIQWAKAGKASHGGLRRDQLAAQAESRMETAVRRQRALDPELLREGLRRGEHPVNLGRGPGQQAGRRAVRPERAAQRVRASVPEARESVPGGLGRARRRLGLRKYYPEGSTWLLGARNVRRYICGERPTEACRCLRSRVALAKPVSWATWSMERSLVSSRLRAWSTRRWMTHWLGL